MSMKVPEFNIRWFPVVSGLLTGLAFLSDHLGGLVLVGLVPFIWYAAHAGKLLYRQIMVDCCLAAVVYSLICLVWILQTVPSLWIDVHGSTAVVLKTVEWLVMGLVSGLGFGLVIGFFIGKTRHQTARMLALLPFAWALGELARSYSLALFTLGPGSSLSPNWNFGSLGLAVASTPLAYLSRFVGLYGLTMVAVFVNLAVYLAIVKKRKSALAITLVILLLNLAAWDIYRPGHGQMVSLAAVTLNTDQDSLKDWGHIALPSKNTNVLVLPEYSLFFDNPRFAQFARANFGDKTTVVTSRSGAGIPKTNELVYYSNHGGIISIQPKTFLAPFGEYMPYTGVSLLNATGQQSVMDSFRLSAQVRPGDQPERPIRSNGITIGGLACSGVLNLDEYRRLAHEGANVLTNSASLNLLAPSTLYHVQELYQNRFHAISNARPFVQSAYSGESYVISSDGKMLVNSGGHTGLIQVSVPLQAKRTLYSLL